MFQITFWQIWNQVWGLGSKNFWMNYIIKLYFLLLLLRSDWYLIFCDREVLYILIMLFLVDSVTSGMCTHFISLFYFCLT